MHCLLPCRSIIQCMYIYYIYVEDYEVELHAIQSMCGSSAVRSSPASLASLSAIHTMTMRQY